MIIMKEIIYKTIGRKGRTTIPFIFRMRLEIADDTLLKFTTDGSRVIVSPMKECGSEMCERKRLEVSQDDARELIEHCSDESLKTILSAVLKKLNLTAVDGNGKNQQQTS